MTPVATTPETKTTTTIDDSMSTVLVNCNVNEVIDNLKEEGVQKIHIRRDHIVSWYVELTYAHEFYCGRGRTFLQALAHCLMERKAWEGKIPRAQLSNLERRKDRQDKNKEKEKEKEV